MLRFLPAWLRGSLSAILLAANTVLLAPFLLAVSLLRAAWPAPSWHRLCGRGASAIAELWIDFNRVWLRLTRRIDWDLPEVTGLRRDAWYLVVCNHQSWADIVILQSLLNRHIPLPRFFLKQQLIWVPVIGLCWWALDFPFMKRYSREYLERHPEKRGVDAENARRACAKLRAAPATIFTFLEGTRFSEEKHRAQQSPYHYLLRPKAGGIAGAIGAMDGRPQQLLDFTIAYAGGRRPGFWTFLCGSEATVTVRLHLRDIPSDFHGRDYAGDSAFREAVQTWVREIWEEKDALLDELYRGPAHPPPP